MFRVERSGSFKKSDSGGAMKKPAMTLTQEAQKFYSALGQCITIWSHIEGRMFLISQLCLGTSESLAAIVFFRTPSLEGKASLTNDLISHYLEPEPRKSGKHAPPLLKRWSKIHSKIKQRIAFRNYIAHQPDRLDIETLWAIAKAKGATVDQFDQIYDEATVIKQHKADFDRRPLKISQAGLAELEGHFEEMSSIFESLNEFVTDLHAEVRSGY